MSTQRQTPRSKSRTEPAQPQSSPHREQPLDERELPPIALLYRGSQGRYVAFSLREEDGDDNATRH